MELEFESKRIKNEEKLFHWVNVHTCVINADVKRKKKKKLTGGMLLCIQTFVCTCFVNTYTG